MDSLSIWVTVGVLALAWPAPAADSAAKAEALVTRKLKSMNEKFDLGIKPLSLRLSDDPYTDIQGPKLHDYLRSIVAVSEQSRKDGEKLWGRICGTRYERQALDYVRAQFERWGLRNVQARSFPRVPQWWPTGWEVSILGDSSAAPSPRGPRSLVSAFPAVHAYAESSSGTTPPQGIEADLVDIGLGREADLRGKDLRRKIAVIHSFPTPSPFAHTGFGMAERLSQLPGVAGLITILDIPGNVQSAALGSVSSKFPCFTVGHDDGILLDEAFAKAAPNHAPRARLKLTAKVETDMTAANIYGELPGATDEYVIVIAHLDGYFDGAMDNASGVATMLALAEHFAAQPAEKRRRNMMFVGTAGHHAGSPGTDYMIRQQAQLLQKTVFVLNSEHTASVEYVQWGDRLVASNTESPKEAAVTNLSPLLLTTLREALDRYGVVTMTSTTTPHWARGDPGAFAAVVPVIGLIGTPVYYHTTADSPDYVTPQGMERTARAFAWLLDRTDSFSRKDLEQGAQPLRPR